MLKGHPRHTSAYLLLSWYFVWKQRDKSFISHTGQKLYITRILTAAACSTPQPVREPDQHSLPVTLGGTLQLLSSLLPATSSVQSAATLPEKYLEGWKQPCCHFKGKERRKDVRVNCAPYPLPLSSPHARFTYLALDTSCCVHMHI